MKIFFNISCIGHDELTEKNGNENFCANSIQTSFFSWLKEKPISAKFSHAKTNIYQKFMKKVKNLSNILCKSHNKLTRKYGKEKSHSNSSKALFFSYLKKKQFLKNQFQPSLAKLRPLSIKNLCKSWKNNHSIMHEP